MTKIRDIKGMRFGSLIALKRIGSNEKGHSLWECKCDCGKTVVNLSNRLLTGNSSTCGCRNGHGMRYTRLYRTWVNMKSRCSDPKQDSYRYYGARGISVCDEWLNFKNFMKWAFENGYKDNLTIDRKNSSKNYEPSNCRWLSLEENSRNAQLDRRMKK